MSVVVTAEKFVHVPCLRAETVYTKVMEFRNSVLASVTIVQHLSPVRLFSVNELHQRLLTVLGVATVPASPSVILVLKFQTIQGLEGFYIQGNVKIILKCTEL